MPLVVEDGTAKADADSYVSAADFSAYAAKYGVTLNGPDPRVDPALRRATDYIDATYRGRFSGYPVNYGVQALEWPRIGAYLRIPDVGRAEAFLYSASAYYYRGGLYYVQDNVVPPQIIKATCDAAMREFTKAGILAPDLKRGGSIEEVQAGSVRVRYGANSPTVTTFQTIDNALKSLLMDSNPYAGTTVRR
jgi:hypothetical protein